MIRERCSCGAEFETDEKSATRLVRDWRANHFHEITAEEQRDATIETTLGFTAEPSPRELHKNSHDLPWEE